MIFTFNSDFKKKMRMHITRSNLHSSYFSHSKDRFATIYTVKDNFKTQFDSTECGNHLNVYSYQGNVLSTYDFKLK